MSCIFNFYIFNEHLCPAGQFSNSATNTNAKLLPVTVRQQTTKNMATSIIQFSDRITQLIDLANRTLATKQTSSGMLSSSWVNSELFFEFRTSSLSFIQNLYGESHPFYKDFNQIVERADPYDTEQGCGKCFYETFVQGSTAVVLLNFSAKNPPHRQALIR